MVGAFAGALVVLTLSVLFSWPADLRAEQPIDDAQSAAQRESRLAAEAFDSPPGSCLQWARPDARDMHKVDCAQPHVFEVTGVVDVSADHGPDADPPAPEQWRLIAQSNCTAGASAYLGGKLDPFGTFSVNALRPPDDKWRGGDRKVRCGLQRSSSLPGRAAGQDQSNVHPPGTCLALVGKTVGDPVDCRDAHAYEIVGIADLSVLGPAYPQIGKQHEKLAEVCQQIVAQYSNNADLSTMKLILSWDTLAEESWNIGSRKVDCKVGARLSDGSGLAPVSGSLKAATGPPPPAGTPPVPPTTGR
ncbi:putative regulator of septum formation [Herbihabitans rhizosphaerae]|uniref:Putative regulator of septum formation n=2 Tax=Herbihabitans rhizosphaerae TaxID=1872711 RepID=A0A4Q7L9Q3_9PSEU|nr:putative regulator of septum formation [Herbihabitans rhizosphaerae]